ncbi:hypothetical protein EV182_001370, partial [Spiromyces aspiralis]
DYLERLQMYRQPVWTCEVTGKSGLTYEEASRSEQISFAKKEGQSSDGFSTPLRTRILNFIHGYSGPISDLIDDIIQHFWTYFTVGDRLEVRNTDQGPKVCDALVLAIQSPQTEGPNEGRACAESFDPSAYTDDLGAVLNGASLDDVTFIVSPLDSSGQPTTGSDMTVQGWQLSHPKTLFSKAKLRRFIKTHASVVKDPQSHFEVLPELQVKYGVNSIPGLENKRKQQLGSDDEDDEDNAGRPTGNGTEVAPSPLRKKARVGREVTDKVGAGIATFESLVIPIDLTSKPAIQLFDPETELRIPPFKKYPIDDLDLIQLLHIKHKQGIVWEMGQAGSSRPKEAAKQLRLTESWKLESQEDVGKPTGTSPRWSIPSSSFHTPPQFVTRQLSIFIFLNSFSKSLMLSPFGLDQFEAVLNYHVKPIVACDNKARTSPLAASDIDRGHENISSPEQKQTRQHIGAILAVPPLITEVHVALLNTIINDRKHNKNSVWSNRVMLVAKQAEAEASEDQVQLKSLRETVQNGHGSAKSETDEQNDEEEPGIVDGAAVRPPVPPPPPLPKKPRTGGTKDPRPLRKAASSVASSDAGPADFSDTESTASKDTVGLPDDGNFSADESSVASNQSIRRSTRIAVKRSISRSQRRPAVTTRLATRRSRRGRAQRAASSSETEPEEDSEFDDQYPQAGDDNGGYARNYSGGGDDDACSMVTETSANGHEFDKGRQDASPLNMRKYLRKWATGWSKKPIPKTRGHWEYKLLGWMIEASHDYPQLKPLISAFSACGISEVALQQQLVQGFTLDERLTILECLVNDATMAGSVREYIEECYEAIQEIKRERMDVKRELKKATDSLAQIEKEEKASAMVAQEDTAAATLTTEGEGEGGAGNGKAMSNPPTMASMREQSRKELQQAHQRQLERRRLGEAEFHCIRKLEQLEREMRRYEVGSLCPIGIDRYLNRYYYIDGLGGSLASSTGRLFVVPCTYSERQRIALRVPQFVMKGWELELGDEWIVKKPGTVGRGHKVSSSLSDMVNVIECGSTIEEDPFPMWGYYSTPEQIDALLKWLNPKGRRELALINQINLFNSAITSGMRKRNLDLDRRGLLPEQKLSDGDAVEGEVGRSRSVTPNPVAESAAPAHSFIQSRLSYGQDRSNSNSNMLNGGSVASSRASSVDGDSEHQAQQSQLRRSGRIGRSRRGDSVSSAKDRADVPEPIVPLYMDYKNYMCS